MIKKNKEPWIQIKNIFKNCAQEIVEGFKEISLQILKK